MLFNDELKDYDKLRKSSVVELMKAQGSLQENLFQAARNIRKLQNLEQVTLRGVIEISNYCQKSCDYCAMRCVNKGLNRYRLSRDEILTIAAEIKKAKISTVFLQSGQDPECDAILEEVIPEMKNRLELGVLLCLGEKQKETYRRYKDLGADSYILKFETSDARLYQQMAHTPLPRRLDCIRWIKEAGLKLGTGNIVGLPNQSLEVLVEDIRLALELQPDFVSSSPFIPNENTPFEHLPMGDLNLTLNMMALWRILLKKCWIPSVSALEKVREGGQLSGLMAGANVITINFTPEASRDKYSIYSMDRFIVSLDHALEIAERAGLRVHSPAAAG
jgi:biotin synthase